MLLIAGHGAGDPGACGNGYKEADLTRDAVSLLKSKLAAYNVNVTVYPTSQNCYADLKAGKSYAFYKYDFAVEIHFNAYNKSAHGVEVLYKMTAAKNTAINVCAAIAKLGFTNRGPKVRTDLKVMNTCAAQKTPHILIETCFIDNAGDIKLYQGVKGALWNGVAASLASSLGLKKASATTTKKTYPGVFPVLPSKGYLCKGDVSSQVSRLQSFLNWYGNYGLAVDSSFGPATLLAVKKYQKAEGLAVDGFFGPASLKRAKEVKK